MEIILHEFQDAFLSFFRGLGKGFSGCLGLENKLENETCFSEKTDSEKWIWVCKSVGIWAL